MPTAPPQKVTTVAEDAPRYKSFYVPAFEIRIKGTRLARDVIRDIIQVTYKDSVNQIDSFELTVNNWDADHGKFKYVGAEETEKKNGVPSDTFDPGDTKKEVEIWMGYSDTMNLMMTGLLTTLEPNYQQSASSTLIVRGQNVLWQLKRKQHTDYWPPNGQGTVRDSQIARDIGNKVDGGQKRFPLSIRIDENALNSEPEEHNVFQNNQHDIVFLLCRARRHGYTVFVEEVAVKGKKRKQLYFGPSDGSRPAERNVTYRLDWGKSLLQFKPSLTVANQINRVTVRGWDRRRKEEINETVTRKQAGINQDLSDLDPAFDQREEVITDRPVYSKGQAKAMAADILKRQLKDLVKATGATIGLPDLRAGRTVVIGGLGKRFSGTYFITETTHTINDSGYQTTFSARREEPGQAKTV